MLYRQILDGEPANAEAYNALGILALQQGRHDEALQMFRRAVQADSAHGEAHNNIGIVLHSQGRVDQGISAYRKAIAAMPDMAQAHSNLGRALRQCGQPDAAVASFRRARALAPECAEIHQNLGNALVQQGQQDEAFDCFRKALELQPQLAAAHNSIGTIFQAKGLLDEAVVHYRQALALDPGLIQAHHNLGKLFQERGLLEDSETSYRRALALDADFVESLYGLGNTLLSQGLPMEAIASYGKALALRPDYANAHSGILLALQYVMHYSPEELFAEHRRFADRFEAPNRSGWGFYSNDRGPERRLRVGYLSPDFRDHSVAYFIEPVLANHAPDRVETFCYYNQSHRDTVTDRMAAMAAHWVPCQGMTDTQLIERIRDDGIDILVDLVGHTADNRLQVFARKPAPIQVTWIGYPDTTGLAAMDYRITDLQADPLGITELWHSERLVRLSPCFLCYRPPSHAPAVVPLPADSYGGTTFASFNNLAKVNPRVIEVWAEILRRVPTARLLLKSRQLSCERLRARIGQLFSREKVAMDRLLFMGWRQSPNDHLEDYGVADIALDPFPYNGTTTSCEALWMGVPVITLAGEKHAGRVGSSLLAAAGLNELISSTTEEYVNLAVGLAADRDRLRELRITLRSRLAGSPLCDGDRFTRQLEILYRELWRKWCVGNADHVADLPPE